ncbi:hypothetical protein ACH5RR_041172 [Cinchona calisaya]|uniref:Embryonic flower 1 n=1 Tax=Cinchona calisaya TaxID=153742 RepID=A0ABD2XW62_9GENT
MENNNEALEENPSSKSSGSIIQISSIYIDLPPIPMQINECEICHHKFTIRGYTVERRGSNQYVTELFPSDSNPSASVDQLPPMEVPAFRWWRCPKCLVLIETQKGPETVNADGSQAVDANVTSNANIVEDASLLSCPQKIQNASYGDVTAMGEQNESCEQVTDTVGKNTNEGKSSEIEDAIPSGHGNVPAPHLSADASDVNTPSGLQKSAGSSECGIPSETTNIAAAEHRAYGFSGNVDVSESDQCRENEHSTGMPRRKIRKVRLLAELLGDKSSSKGGTRENNPRANSVLVESAGSRNAGSEDQVNNLQKPSRKTKVTREGEESNGPSNMTTNIRAPRRDTGKAIMEAEVTDSDSDAEVNAFPGEGLFIGTKSERLRHRSESTPALSRKKNKQPHVPDFATAVPSLPGSLHVPSVARCWGSHQSPEQTDGHRADFVPEPLKSLPSHNSSAKPGGLDLSLNSFVKKIDINQGVSSKELVKNDGMLFRESVKFSAIESDACRGPLWDLNEKAAQSSYNLKRGIFPPHKEMDFLQLGLHEKNSEVQGNLKESDCRGDDIPMEIVEMLAKKQYERSNGEIGNPSVAHVTSSTPRRFLEVEEIRTVKEFAKAFPNFPDFRSVNVRNGMASNSMGAAKQNSFSFSQMGRNHLKMVHGGEYQPKSIFTAFPQNNPKLYSGTHIPVAASLRPGLQCSETVEPLSLSSSTKVPFERKLAAEQHKGKTISDIKADELRKLEEARLIFPKPGDTVDNSKAKGSLDPYANESIPAMQLLSLMDGRSPGAAFGLGPNKNFAPCSYHPTFSTSEGQDFLSGSFFSRHFHHKETSGLGAAYSDSYPGQISFKHPEQDKSGTGAGPSSSRVKDKKKANPSAFDCVLGPQKQHRLANARSFNLEAFAVSGGARPVKSVSPEGECRLNRNPADFSIPEARNEYTICARDLKSRKRNVSRERAPSVGGAKRQRVTKAKPGNEHVQRHSS